MSCSHGIDDDRSSRSGRNSSLDRNLVLTGFMGTGKSVVARLAAERLQWPLVDMDQIIVDRTGMSINDIFEQQGEASFRQMEKALCQELGEQSGRVIATGGGTLVDSENRELLERNGCVVCLDCSLEELVSRLRHSDSRPLLQSDTTLENHLGSLIAQRRSTYAEIAHHIDTTSLDAAQVAEKAIETLGSSATFWRVSTPSGSYQVHLQRNGLSQIGALLRARGEPSHVVLVSDEHVGPLYAERVLESLQLSRFQTSSIILPAGEQHKTLDTMRTLYDRFLDAGLDRSGVVVAMGGGVITDMTGFAAATFMRGVPVVQVPTTLLGMIDASVGGKVAIDLPQGKNLVGAFIKPHFVMIDPLTLQSLPKLDYASGMAEVIKHGIIEDTELFQALETSTQVDQQWLIKRALAVKVDVVEEDPFERGRRVVLNLGHTFAHALEVMAGYGLYHGLAVAMGMVAAANLAVIRDICSDETRKRIIATLALHGLPTAIEPQSAEGIVEAMGRDKKKQGNSLRFILPRDIGSVSIERDIPKEQVIAALERTMR